MKRLNDVEFERACGEVQATTAALREDHIQARIEVTQYNELVTALGDLLTDWFGYEQVYVDDPGASMCTANARELKALLAKHDTPNAPQHLPKV